MSRRKRGHAPQPPPLSEEETAYVKALFEFVARTDVLSSQTLVAGWNRRGLSMAEKHEKIKGLLKELDEQ